MEKNKIRKFNTGATRDTDQGKYEYARALSPLSIQRFGKYMDKHRLQKDGSIRDPDNWKKGFPIQSFVDSLFRHMVDVWLIHEGEKAIRPETGEEIDIEEALCGMMFNSMGMLHEVLKEKNKNGKQK